MLARRPDLVLEWDYDKNGILKPENVTAFSDKKVWWKCDKGHSWEAVISSRANGRGCPFCNRRLAITGETDLKTRRPDLVLEWDYDKNGELKPENFTEFSGKKVWWLCKTGHSWKATIYSRARGCGCPYDSGHKKWNG